MSISCIHAADGSCKPGKLRRGMCDFHYMEWWNVNRRHLKTPKPCGVEGCDSPRKMHGYCSLHGHRFKRHGDPLGGMVLNGEPLKAFYEEVLTYEGDECLLWRFGRNGQRRGQGYGIICIDGKNQLVHRLACEHKKGPPPDPKSQCRHICGNGALGCCNWRHTEWGTAKENAADRRRHGTDRIGADHPGSKLTEADVRQIRSLGGTMSQQKIADRFGLGQMTVCNIIRRKSWKHIE